MSPLLVRSVAEVATEMLQPLVRSVGVKEALPYSPRRTLALTAKDPDAGMRQ